ncbi:Aste57867_11130 [Aphanomyces stellatus]|uniref:Aste57867_11130 protein n=1 Tax=Aphanomyces stellatus TaxID=120398 RepID=A0A485KSM9_9STRA|nr:hypothetical protein As57867_011088 [Aphanomyces stellatus]VFT87997.1 Aste57867_11130 [Aphanomyces stellatus]
MSVNREWGRIKSVMERHGLPPPWDSLEPQFMASFDSIVASPKDKATSLDLTDDQVLWELIQATLEHLKAAPKRESKTKLNEATVAILSVADTTAKDEAELRPTEPSTPHDDQNTSLEMKRDASAPVIVPLRSEDDDSMRRSVSADFTLALSPPPMQTLGSSQAIKLGMSTETCDAVASPPTRQRSFEQLFGRRMREKRKAKSKNTVGEPPPPPREAKIVVGGLTADGVTPVARYIHLLGYGQVVHATSSDQAIEKCQPLANGGPPDVDLVLFVVGRDLDRAVPMVDTLTALVGHRVIVIGGDPENAQKTANAVTEASTLSGFVLETVLPQCMAHGALSFATTPIAYPQLRRQMQRELEREPHKFIFRRKKKEKPLSLLFKALNRRSSVDGTEPAKPKRTTPVPLTSRSASWFKPKGKLPSLNLLSKKLSSGREAAETEPPESKTKSWQAGSPRTARLASLPTIELVASSSSPSKPSTNASKPPSPRPRWPSANSSRRSIGP